MAQVYLGIGSNLNRKKNIAAVLTALQRQFGEIIQSSLYQSAAVNGRGDDYYNMVVSFNSKMSPVEIKQWGNEIEQQLKRDRQDPTRVSIDLDLLLYDDWVGDFEGVTLPHADVDLHLHVLQPLAEINPEGTHPLTQKTFQTMLRETSRRLPKADN